MPVKTTIPVNTLQQEDYAIFLRVHNLTYKEVEDCYLQVREIKKVQGWILHVSTIKSQLPALLKTLIPVLGREKVPFKIAKDKASATLLLNGQAGYTRAGKVISIYPENDDSVVRIAQKIIPLTKDYRGPAVPTDIHLGGVVYTRYGSFQPILQSDELGNLAKFIYDANGQLVKDTYDIPFKLPKGIHWPFETITKLVVPKVDNFLNDKYLVTSTLKSDAKGDVYKALRLNGLWVENCIVKEGKHNMFADDNARGIQERLHWQYKLHLDLTELPLPRIYDYFQENNSSYIVMECIKGIGLSKVIEDTYKNKSWGQLELPDKVLLLDHLLQVIDAIEKLHEKGIIHRDITPPNFIITKKNKVVMIDLELAYSTQDNFPDPPFNFGTNGFMSPEQLATQTPTSSEDIYGLGALMIVFFTNLYPVKFNMLSLKLLEEKLFFFTQDNDLVNLVIQCLQRDAKDRPGLREIKEIIQNYRIELPKKINKRSSDNYQQLQTTPERIKKLVHDSILALNSRTIIEPGRVWHSNVMQDEQLVANKQRNYTYYAGLYGISGILYTVSNAKKIGVPIDKVMPNCTRAYKYLQQNFLSGASSVVPGLFSGASGMAMFLSVGFESGMVRDNIENRNAISKCLKLKCHGLDVASGVAGQTLATLHCLPYLNEATANSLLENNIDTILKRQQKDGSWLSDKDQSLKVTGLAHGVAGITCLLMEYNFYFKNEQVQNSILRALKWLSTQAKNIKGKITWFPTGTEKLVSPWLNDGIAGIALCFIRAYEMFNDQYYRQIAEGALYNHPRNLICRNLSQAEGISGIGEAYLEAFRVFQDQEWKLRADWIVDLIINTAHYQDDGSCYWVVDDYKVSTADFMVGISGVIFFIMRHSASEELNFPLFPFRNINKTLKTN